MGLSSSLFKKAHIGSSVPGHALTGMYYKWTTLEIPLYTKYVYPPRVHENSDEVLYTLNALPISGTGCLAKCTVPEDAIASVVSRNSFTCTSVLVQEILSHKQELLDDLAMMRRLEQQRAEERMCYME